MREPKMIIAIGTKGVGKTHTTCDVIQRYTQSDEATGKEGRKVLIFDVNEEYNNEEIGNKGFTFQTQLLDIKDLVKFAQQKRVEVRRILPRDENGKPLGIDGKVKMLNQILEEYKGGMLLLEDINSYMVDTTAAKGIISSMTTNRHKDMDIYIHLQSLAPVTPRMWQNCTEIRFHKQSDTVARYKNRIPNDTLYFITEALVNMVYLTNQRFYVYVNNEYQKIRGAFTKKTFQLACYSFLQDNPSIISNAQKRYHKDKSAREKAIRFCLQDLMRYYGNAE